jgi:nucleotide-binding universal stress UspA family protein
MIATAPATGGREDDEENEARRMYKKILLTLDGSDLSTQAIAHAAALAKATDGQIIVVQVIDSEGQIISQASGATIEPISMGTITVEIAREAVEAQRNAAKANLDAAKKALEADGVKNVTTVVREGSPGDQIVEAAETEGADVVVIATHGRSGFKRAILGSVADHVVRNTPNASVLLIRPKA